MPQRQSRISGGDFTGREKARMNKEQEQAALDRQHELSMQNVAEDEETRNGVFDPHTGQRIDGGGSAYIVDDDGEEGQQGDHPLLGDLFAGEPVLTGHEDMTDAREIVAAQPPAKRQVPDAVAQVLRDADVVFRPNQDIENMTFGMTPNGEPNNLNFLEGKAYKVPRPVFEHLHGLGLVGQVVRG